MVDDRSPMAKSLGRASDVFIISLLMVVPGLMGYGLDQWLGTPKVFLLIGFFLGMIGATAQLYRLVVGLQDGSKPNIENPEDNETIDGKH